MYISDLREVFSFTEGSILPGVGTTDILSEKSGVELLLTTKAKKSEHHNNSKERRLSQVDIFKIYSGVRNLV